MGAPNPNPNPNPVVPPDLITDPDHVTPIDPAFIVPIEQRPSYRRSHPAIDRIPIIDLSPLHLQEQGLLKEATVEESCVSKEAAGKGDYKEREAIVREVGLACEEWGFFQVINHGIPSSYIQNLKEAARDFFTLPIEEKVKVKRSSENALGFNDGELTKNTRDWKEVFDIVTDGAYCLPSDDGDGDGDGDGDDHVQVFPNRWPSNLPMLRKACEEYVAEAEKLAFTLLELISESLGLPPDVFHEHFVSSGTSLFRLNHYPVCPAPHLALGVSRHKDIGALTILLQDEVGGLEVRRKDGEWIGIEPNTEALVINVGDLIQVYSNDKYNSVEHRVVVHENVDRYSFPLFFNPAHWVNVSPIKELLDDEHPPRYRPFNWGRYIKSRNDSNFKNLGVENRQIYHYAINV